MDTHPNRKVIGTCPFGHQCTRYEQKGAEVLEYRCMMYIELMGSNPQTGESENRWGCSLAFMPMLQIETAQQVRQAGASVDQLRCDVATQTPALAQSHMKHLEGG